MTQRSTDCIFHTLNINICNILQDGLDKIQKLGQNENMSDHNVVFLRYMKFFVDHALDRLQVSAEVEKARQLHYYKLRYENKMIQKKISALSKSLEERRNKIQEIERQTNIQYKKNIELLEKLENQCAEKAEILSMKYECMQINEYKQSERRQNDLMQIYGMTQKKVENSVMSNERLLSEIYSKRFKVMSQYMALINRYDMEIGEKQTIIDNLKCEFNKINEKRHRLEDEMEKQSEIFDSYVYAIRATKIKEFTDRMKLSKITNAAKKIQQWWRSIIINRKNMKKRKRKKKKKRRKMIR